jgi:hypothetical protein
MNFIYNFFITKVYAQTTTPWGFPILHAPHTGTGPESYDMWDVLSFIGNIINIALIFASVLAVIYIIIGGYKYVMSVGKPEAIQQAKDTIYWAIAGLIICLAAYIIIQFVWIHVTGQSQIPTN